MVGYTLEVVAYITDRDGPYGFIAKGGRFEHMGYMRAHFQTKEDACSYYDRHNSHMRPLNLFGNYRSNWDPRNNLIYIVREDYELVKTVAPFDPADDYDPVALIAAIDAGITIDWKWLK